MWMLKSSLSCNDERHADADFYCEPLAAPDTHMLLHLDLDSISSHLAGSLVSPCSRKVTGCSALCVTHPNFHICFLSL